MREFLTVENLLIVMILSIWWAGLAICRVLEEIRDSTRDAGKMIDHELSRQQTIRSGLDDDDY